jgi:FkbM family methyltransferase
MTGFLLTIYKIGAKIFTGTGISQNRVIRKILHKMNSQLKSEFVNIEGNRLFLDVEDALFLSVNGLHEKTETELIKKEIKKGDFVIDIGANIGYYTLLFAKLVGSSGHVLAFEPESKNFELLKKNVNENNYKNVTLIQKAISNENKIKNFYLTHSGTTAHRLSKPHDGNDSIKIETIYLDDFLKNFKKPVNFVKIDIHGAEGKAIKGMLSTIKKTPSIKILQEWWPDAIKDYDMEPEEHLNILTKLGFSLYEIDDVHQKIIESSIDELLNKYPTTKIKDVNIFCKRKNID